VVGGSDVAFDEDVGERPRPRPERCAENRYAGCEQRHSADHDGWVDVSEFEDPAHRLLSIDIAGVVLDRQVIDSASGHEVSTTPRSAKDAGNYAWASW
jgi:hypothetical protein